MNGAPRGSAATSGTERARRRGFIAAPRACAWAAVLAATGAACAAPTLAPEAKPAAASAGPLPTTCTLADAYFTARLRGTLEREVRWRATQMTCEGMNRPDRKGVRVAFSGRSGDEPLTFVLGIPRLAEGASGDDVPVNLTVIREGGGLYGTRGEDKCMLDSVRQTGLDVPPSTAKPRRWRIEARGFCLEPARNAANDGRDAILVATFDFAGYVTWEPDSTPAMPPVVAPVAPRPATSAAH